MNPSLSGLSLKQAPPLVVPLMFFLTAPVFLLLAAVLLWHLDTTAWVSRWSGGILALTHLLTLGYLTMVMLGALLQMLPVVAGSVVPGGRWIAVWVHGWFVLASLLLAWALFHAEFSWLTAIVIMMSLSLGGFASVALYALFRSMVRHATVRLMRYAVVALVLTALTGMLMLAGLAGKCPCSMHWLVGLHVTWGTMGWMAMLMMGVAWQVVPMFLLTPVYPAVWVRHAGNIWLLLLVMAVAAAKMGATLWVVRWALACGMALFAVMTLYVLAKRRRRNADASVWFWRVSMISLSASAALWLVASCVPVWKNSAVFPFALGGLFLYGGMASLVNGMLYKIVPFLIWMHWQARLPKGQVAPNVRQVIPMSLARHQMWVHAASVCALLVSIWSPGWVRPAAGLIGLSAMALWYALWHAGWQYWRYFMKYGASVQ